MIKLIRLSFCHLQLRIIKLVTITIPHRQSPSIYMRGKKNSFKVPGGNALGPQSKNTKYINIK